MCDDRFSDNAANAICREMGHQRATKWKSGSPYYWEFRTYRETQLLDITLDDVRCREFNSNWDTCSYSTTHNCDHSEDVYLACYSYTGNTAVICILCLLRCPWHIRVVATTPRKDPQPNISDLRDRSQSIFRPILTRIQKKKKKKKKSCHPYILTS